MIRALGILIALTLALVTKAGSEGGNLPTRDPDKAIPVLMALENKPDMKRIGEILGTHDREVGSGRCIYVYVLRDGSEIWVNTGDCVHVDWITRVRKGKPNEELFPPRVKH